MKKNIINKIIYVIVSIFLIVAIVFLVKYFSSKNIKMVRNILKPVYSDITCIDDNCSSIKAIMFPPKYSVFHIFRARIYQHLIAMNF